MIGSYFIAKLKCLHCGLISPEDVSTNLATSLKFGESQEVRVGQALPSGEITSFLLDSGYLPLGGKGARSGGNASRLHLLETWDCPHCATVGFAKVSLSTRVDAIEAVPLDRDTLDAVEFVSEDILTLAGLNHRDLGSLPIVQLKRLLLEELSR